MPRSMLPHMSSIYDTGKETADNAHLSDKAALGELYDDSEIDLALNLVDQGLSGFAALSLIDRLAGIRSSLRDGKLSQEDADAHALAATQMALHKVRRAS